MWMLLLLRLVLLLHGAAGHLLGHGLRLHLLPGLVQLKPPPVLQRHHHHLRCNPRCERAGCHELNEVDAERSGCCHKLWSESGLRRLGAA